MATEGYPVSPATVEVHSTWAKRSSAKWGGTLASLERAASECCQLRKVAVVIVDLKAAKSNRPLSPLKARAIKAGFLHRDLPASMLRPHRHEACMYGLPKQKLGP